MALEDEIYKVRNILIKASSGASKSMYKKLIYDIDSFNSLVEVLYMNELKISMRSIRDNDLFCYNVQDNLYNLEPLADRVIKMFKDMNFYCYLYRGYSNISLKEKTEIFSSFLNDFLPDAYKIYKEMCNQKRVFSGDIGCNSGESFIMQTSGNYFLAINQNMDNDLFELETYVHELMHIYVHSILKNYSSSTFGNTFNGFYLETIPLYGELAFYDWMINNHVYVKDMEFHRNLVDYLTLQFFKTMKYLAIVFERDDIEAITNNQEYKILGNNRVLIDDGIPYFQYHKELSEGNLNDFQYGLGIIDAYNLLERERTGEDVKTSINEYLVSLQNENKFDEDLMQGHNLSFMNSEIKARMDIMKKKYPLPGYKVFEK